MDGRCKRVMTCMECPLRLEFSDMLIQDDNIYINIILVYQRADDGPSARMFELNIATDPPLDLIAASEGDALEESRKSLAYNAETGNPWHETSYGKYRLAALSLINTNDIEPGVIARFEFAAPKRVINTEVKFWVEQKLQILAPEEADVLLQISPYYDKMKVTPR